MSLAKEDSRMKNITVTKRFTFEASHNLIKYEGKCSNLHGHSYKLEVSFTSESRLNSQGMVLDFNLIDEIVKPIVDRYDHHYLNDFFSNPTAEVMAGSIFNEIQYILSDRNNIPNFEGIYISEVKLWETEKCFVSVKGD